MDGADTNPGSHGQPFATLRQARDAIRADRAATPGNAQSYTVYLRSGTYRLNKTFVLEEEDGGTSKAPITYRAAAGERVILTTGTRLPVERSRPADRIELSHLHPSAQGRVRVLELAGTDEANVFPGGQGDYGMLVSGEHTLQLSRWPNRGFVHIEEVIDMGPTLRWLTRRERPPAYSFESPVGGKFSLRESTRWQAWRKELDRTQDIRQDGYLSNDWTQDDNQVARIADDGVVQLLDATRYGIGGVRFPANYADPSVKPKFQPYRRLYFKNVLCELDMPGEWYFDRAEQKLYYWPIDDDPVAGLRVAGGPVMIALRNASNLTLRGLTFDGGGDLALSIEAGEGNRVVGCTFRNLEGRAIEVSGGTKHTLDACDVYNAKSAFSISGGNLTKLDRAGHRIVNCDFHRLRRRGYGGGVISGCGITFRNNIWHDMNAAINYKGVYIDFINNEFFNVGWEMGDWNVLYQGAQRWCNGNRVVNNFFHHMMEEPGRHPILAARNDDGGTGTTYQSNLFIKTGRGAIAFNGPNNHIRHNIVLDCPLLWWTAKGPTRPEAIQQAYDTIAQQFESGRYKRGGKEDIVYNVERVVGRRGWASAPWQAAFPAFAKYMDENPFAQSYGSMQDNYHDRADARNPYSVVHIHRNWTVTRDEQREDPPPTMRDMPDTFVYNAPRPFKADAMFVDRAGLDFRIHPGAELSEGFEPIDFEQVGLYKSEYRTDPPNPLEYRQRVFQQYKSTRSTGGRYDPDTAYLRYPKQPWLE